MCDHVQESLLYKCFLLLFLLMYGISEIETSAHIPSPPTTHICIAHSYMYLGYAYGATNMVRADHSVPCPVYTVWC